MESACPNITLNNGVKMPVCGLGTFLSTDEKIMTDLLRAAFGNYININPLSRRRIQTR